MTSHPVDILKAALQEAKTEAATLRIKTATLAKERNVVIEERNAARARVAQLEQQVAVQAENVAEAMREVERLRAAAGNGCGVCHCKALADAQAENTRLRATLEGLTQFRVGLRTLQSHVRFPGLRKMLGADGQCEGCVGVVRLLRDLVEQAEAVLAPTALRTDPEGHPPRSPIPDWPERGE